MKKRLAPLLCTGQRKHSFDDQTSLYNTDDESEIELLENIETIRNHRKKRRRLTFIRNFRALLRRISNSFHQRPSTTQPEIIENIYETIPFEFSNIRSIETTLESTDYWVTQNLRPKITWKHSWDLSETQDALSASTFSNIPDEIYLQIFRLLSVRELGNISLVCRQFKMIADDDEIWKLKCKTSKKLISKSFKQMYIDWIYEKYLYHADNHHIYREITDILYLIEPMAGFVSRKYPIRLLPDILQSSVAKFIQHPNSSQNMTIQLSVNLDETVSNLLCLLEKTTAFQIDWYQKPTVIKQMILRYYRFMKLKALSLSNILLIPTLDIEIIWQTHLSRPEIYRNDCLRLFGEIINHSLITNNIEQFLKNQAFADTCQLYEEYFGEKYCSLPDSNYERLFTNREYRSQMTVYPYWDETYFQFDTDLSNDYENPFSFTESDIIADKNWLNLYKNFMFKMHSKISDNDYRFSLKDTRSFNSTQMILLKKSYERFLYMAAKYPSIHQANLMYQTYAIDLIWRSHMQEPLKYISDCSKYLGYVLNRSPASLIESETNMNKIWKNEFNSDITTDHLYRVYNNNYNLISDLLS